MWNGVKRLLWRLESKHHWSRSIEAIEQKSTKLCSSKQTFEAKLKILNDPYPNQREKTINSLLIAHVEAHVTPLLNKVHMHATSRNALVTLYM